MSQIEVNGLKTSQAEDSENLIFKAINPDEDRPAIGNLSKGDQKEKAKPMPKTTPSEETASVGSQKGSVHLEKHAHSSMTRTRQAQERTTSLTVLRQDHRT